MSATVPATDLAPDDSYGTFHNAALLAWLAAAVWPSVFVRHPGYLGVHLLLLVIVYRWLARRLPEARVWGGFARLALVFVLFTLAMNALLGGRGETVLVRLPAWRRLADDGSLLFQIGGAVTLESVVFSLTAAAALLTVIYALATWNVLADHDQLLRGLPAVLYQAATVVSIALTFLPQLAVAQREIREAQALRGHKIRGLRDFLPLLLTLLAEGLDRAMSLAESMEARGFSGPPRPRGARRWGRVGIVLALAALLAGLLGSEAGLPPIAGHVCVAAGGIILAVTLWRLGREVHRTRYRRQRFDRRDAVLAAAGGVVVLAAVGLHASGVELGFEPFPRVAWPVWDMRPVLASLPVLAPVFLLKEPTP